MSILFFPIFRGLSGWLIVLASADRYFRSCQSVNKIAWSSLRVANRAIPSTIFFSLIVYVPVPIFLQNQIVLATGQYSCNLLGPSGIDRSILSYLTLLHFGLLPSIFMLLFGIVTIRNIDRAKRLVEAPTSNNEGRINRKINRQLYQMLFIQVLVYSVTGLAFSAAMIYESIIGNITETAFQLAQEKMINAVVGMFSNFGPCMSFYLFTLSSSLFRKKLKKMIPFH